MKKETLKMTFKEFQQSKQFLQLQNYDDEKVEGYSYATFDFAGSEFCEEHYWIERVNDTQYHLILCNADFLDSDLAKLEKMLYEFIYGEIK
tara:strand:- start:449 stop:721 length:273 start_codon:yes stop_codon:yes gene_type:complete